MTRGPSNRVIEIALQWAHESNEDFGSIASKSEEKILTPEEQETLNQKASIAGRDIARLQRLKNELKAIVEKQST